MPKWLQTQIQRAFLEKNRYQIKVLNQMWFFYVNRIQTKNEGKNGTQST